MTNEKAIKALRTIKTYCSATQLEELDYAIEVLEKLEKDGIKEPLATDFTSLAKQIPASSAGMTLFLRIKK